MSLMAMDVHAVHLTLDRMLGYYEVAFAKDSSYVTSLIKINPTNNERHLLPIDEWPQVIRDHNKRLEIIEEANTFNREDYLK